MYQYAAITFSPVQGFIEKTRKLRDLYGSSIILSYLSQYIAQEAKTISGVDVISPGLINTAQGMPNRILLKNKETGFDSKKLEQWVRETLLTAWRKVCDECKKWIEFKLRFVYLNYHWDRDWGLWRTNTWEIFWGSGNTIAEAMKDLENRKLSRNWTGVNWIGESSSITGTDAIAWPGLGSESREPKRIDWNQEEKEIKKFYRHLAFILEGKNPEQQPPDEKPEGKYIDENEKLNIPELIKRLITLPEIADQIKDGLLPSELREKGFTDLSRRPQDNPNGKQGQWTGWFMGDGDQVGKFLTEEVEPKRGDEGIHEFSQKMRLWGERFLKEFPKKNMGRIVYAGGDDFLGLIYNQDFPKDSQDSIPLDQVLKWLKTLHKDWQTDKPEWMQAVTLSVGFVWAAPSVPQRDVLQHCREAEQQSKRQGRDRLTIRILFNNGQYVQWTTPWEYLEILDHYQDRDGNHNWNHIYNDLAKLKSRHAFSLAYVDTELVLNKDNKQEFLDDRKALLKFFDCYFEGYEEKLGKAEKLLFKHTTETAYERAKAMIHWIDDLITVGWYLSRKI
ncbi:Cas10/Cmr2 second palm domain-containing protein [Limnoraphis robusta]|nr:type III-B CRISPR-associated protein Cas10/Cmr2 [Limnoraphis robusta]